MDEVPHCLHHHPLQQTKNNSGTYICNGCNIPGIGSRFRCNICNFDLHECCASSRPSPTFAWFLHPQHQLSLEVCASQNAGQNSRVCSLCGDQVEGLFYRCKICEFDIHLVCTQLPQFVHHAVDNIHPLELEKGPAGCCSICNKVCTSWRYMCGKCGVNIHLECILAPPPPIPPPSAPPPFYGGYGAAGYPMYNGPHQYAYAYQYANAYQYGSSSTGPAASNGKRDTAKNVVLSVGRVASNLASGIFGIPDFSSFF